MKYLNIDPTNHSKADIVVFESKEDWTHNVSKICEYGYQGMEDNPPPTFPTLVKSYTNHNYGFANAVDTRQHFIFCLNNDLRWELWKEEHS